MFYLPTKSDLRVLFKNHCYALHQTCYILMKLVLALNGILYTMHFMRNVVEKA